MTREDRDRYRLFVGKNSDYYIQRWEEINATGKKFGWNWAGFFFGLFWLSYRKMYPHAFGLMIFSLILQYIQKVMNTDPVVVALTNIAISTAIGLFGNYLYYEYAKSKIEEIKNKIPEEEQQNLEIVRVGGESLSTAIAIGLMYLICSSIIEYGLEVKE